MRFGAVLIKRRVAPDVAAWASASMLASAYREPDPTPSIARYAIRNGKTTVVEAVMDPVTVRKNTGRHATNRVATIGRFPLYMEARPIAILRSRSHFPNAAARTKPAMK